MFVLIFLSDNIKEKQMSTVSSAAVDPHTESSSPRIIEEERYRAGAYGLISSLLRTAPTTALVQDIAAISLVDNASAPLAKAITQLAAAATATMADPLLIEDEFHTLFIGVGRGELIPYGSWYLTGHLMERPLSLLRTDLATLGFTRVAGVAEPEDHVAALSDVMQMLIEDGASFTTQGHFFNTHMRSWIGHFFTDLENAEAANFYRSVGYFGTTFMDLEQQYLEADF